MANPSHSQHSLSHSGGTTNDRNLPHGTAAIESLHATPVSPTNSSGCSDFISNKKLMLVIIIVTSLVSILYNVQLQQSTALAIKAKTISSALVTVDEKDGSNSSSNSGCVSKSLDLQYLINTTQNVVILMPAKAAGSTFKAFANSCSGRSHSDLPDNFLNRFNGIQLMTSSYELPPVIASHAYTDKPLTELLKHGSEETLFVWSHRKETSRLVSAIKHVIKVFCEAHGGRRKQEFTFLEKQDGRCVIAEDDLIRKVIWGKKYEINTGAERVLTCNAFDAMKNNLPNLIFIDYKVASYVQAAIAQKYCPDQASNPVRKNVANETSPYYVKLSKKYEGTDETVPLDDWLKVKRSYIEMFLGMKKQMSCQATRRQLENALDSCEDHMVRLDQLQFIIEAHQARYENDIPPGKRTKDGKKGKK